MIGRAILQQLEPVLRRIRTRIDNIAARAVVTLIDDSTTLQTLQLGVLAEEIIDDAEHIQAYGFTSVSLPDADAVVLFPGGDRNTPLVVAVDDRRHRPVGLTSGEVAVYHKDGSQILMKANGDIEITPKTGAQVLIHDGNGGFEPLVKKSEFDGHTHGPGTYTSPSGAVTGLSGGAGAVAGTQDLEAF